MMVTGSVTLCSGTYFLDDPEGDGAIMFSRNFELMHNARLDCNGATLIGSDRPESKGIMVAGYTPRYNTAIVNCNIKGYYNGVYAELLYYSYFSNINITDSGGEGMYIDRFNNTLIENMHIMNASLTSPLGHPLYISGRCGRQNSNIVVRDSYFGFGKTGIHINICPEFDTAVSGFGIKIYNNTFFHNEFGLDSSGTNGLDIYNNTFLDNVQRDIRIWYDESVCAVENCSAKNTRIHDNHFQGARYSNYILYAPSENTFIYNNSYTGDAIITVRDDELKTVSFIVDERDADILLEYLATGYTKNAYLRMYYDGKKKFSVVNSRITSALQSPYNDVRETKGNGIIAYNRNITTITIASGESLEIGDFTADGAVIGKENANNKEQRDNNTYYLQEPDLNIPDLPEPINPQEGLEYVLAILGSLVILWLIFWSVADITRPKRKRPQR